MKKLILFFAIPAVFIACKGNENNSNTGTSDSTSTSAAPADTAKVTSAVQYTCPMHPDVISDKPGTCPQCGMELQVKS